MEAKSTGDLSSLVEEQRLRKTEGGEEEEEEGEEGERRIQPATEPPKRKNFRTDMGSSAPPGGGCTPIKSNKNSKNQIQPERGLFIFLLCMCNFFIDSILDVHCTI